MKFEKKLIACSILATVIGISSVLPLMFLMPATAKVAAPEAGSSESWFSINIPYSYWMTKDGRLDNWDFDPTELDGLEDCPTVDESSVVSSQYLIALNLTLNVDATNYPADARIEYYQIDVNSDKGLIERRCWFVGTVLNDSENSSFSFQEFMEKIHFARSELFGNETFGILSPHGYVRNRSGGMVRHHWEADLSLLWRVGSAGSGTTGNGGTSNLVSAIREAETLSIIVRRVGWVTVSANSTAVTLVDNQVVEEIQLQKYADGFIYNNIIPEEQLATIDPTDPPIDFAN
jgi:hypothetical protein